MPREIIPILDLTTLNFNGIVTIIFYEILQNSVGDCLISVKLGLC